MDPINDRHNQDYADLLGAAALGTLTPEEHALLDAFLHEHADARTELDALRVVASSIPLTLDEREPSRALRDRISDALDVQLAEQTWPGRGSEPVPAPAASVPAPSPVRPPTPIRGGGFRPAYILATAALVLVAIVAGALVGAQFFAADAGLDGETIALNYATGSPPGVTGELQYVADEHLFVLHMNDMPAAPEGSVYQAWLIDDAGPVPVGVISDPANFSVAADRDEWDVFAITVEPAPLGSAEPTTEPLIVAPLTTDPGQ